MSPFQALKCSRTLATHVWVGMGAASFWRGAWYCLDDSLFPENSTQSAASSLALGVVGLAASQGLVDRAERFATRYNSSVVAKAGRFGALYTVALSCVLVWRGTWVGWDCLYERWYDQPATAPGHATQSGILSHSVAVTTLLCTGLFASVLAPPAAVSVIRDGAVKISSRYKGPGQAWVDQLLPQPKAAKQPLRTYSSLIRRKRTMPGRLSGRLLRKQ